MNPRFSQQNVKELSQNLFTSCSLSPLGLIFALLLPDRLIGRTADFGSVSLGSSPSRATMMQKQPLAEWLFYAFLRTRQAWLGRGQELLVLLQTLYPHFSEFFIARKSEMAIVLDAVSFGDDHIRIRAFPDHLEICYKLILNVRKLFIQRMALSA